MYICFYLPSGAGGLAAQHALGVIRSELKQWSQLHEVSYTTKVHRYTLRVILPTEQDYTHFQISWNPSKHLPRYELVEPGQVPPEKLTSSP